MCVCVCVDTLGYCVCVCVCVFVMCGAEAEGPGRLEAERRWQGAPCLEALALTPHGGRAWRLHTEDAPGSVNSIKSHGSQTRPL